MSRLKNRIEHFNLTAKTVSRGESASAAVRNDYIERSGGYANDHAEVLTRVTAICPPGRQTTPENIGRPLTPPRMGQGLGVGEMIAAALREPHRQSNFKAKLL
jgi:hypothetical protein